jgi:hypothetical protein
LLNNCSEASTIVNLLTRVGLNAAKKFLFDLLVDINDLNAALRRVRDNFKLRERHEGKLRMLN